MTPRRHITRRVLARTARRKRVLEVRTIVAETAWLEWSPWWEGGRVVWRDGQRLFAPAASDLARAQRRLYRLARSPGAAAQVLGDHRAWLGRRQARLELAKRLVTLAAPDLPDLLQRVRSGDESALLRAANLLAAEALCANSLPESAAARLAAAGNPAADALARVVADDALPPEARCLAALCLGAGGAERGRPATGTVPGAAPGLPAPLLDAPALRRAYRFGRRAGLTAFPVLTAALLLEDDGEHLARRARAALEATGPLAFDAADVASLRSAGVPAREIVVLAEAVAAVAPLGERLLALAAIPEEVAPLSEDAPEPPPGEPEQPGRAYARYLEVAGRLIRTLTCRSAHPGAPELCRRLYERLLDDAQPHVRFAAASALLEFSSTLAPALALSHLELLLAHQDHLVLAADRLVHYGSGGVEILPSVAETDTVLRLLRLCSDAALVGELLDLRLESAVDAHAWRDPELLRWLATLARLFAEPPGPWQATEELREEYGWLQQRLAHGLAEILSAHPSIRAARAALQPFFDGAVAVPPPLRANFLLNLFQELERLDLSRRQTVPRLARYLPSVIRFYLSEPNGYACWWFLLGLLALDREQPDEAPAWVAFLVEHVLDLARRSPQGWANTGALSVAALLAVTLADGDFARFQAIVRAAMARRFDQGQEALERSIPLLARYPSLRRAVALLFERRPQQCAEIIVRLGMAARLGRDVLAPLEALEVEVAAGPDDPRSYPAGWGEVLSDMPELGALAADYLHARWLLGETLDVPPGVRRALEGPRKLARELAFIQRALATHHHDGLAARAASLRARLDDGGRLLAQARQLAAERLSQLAAEAQLAAADQQVWSCFRARLEQIVGPLPPTLRVDDDLMNAALLTSDVSHNRRLLRDLLRAELRGERAWREALPANAGFLRRLEERGVDAQAWLAAWPRVYRLGGARLRLHLERSPLRILQMGNLFDTCLSLGGGNSFSAVANACDLNKRVLFVTDERGNVVARKLIAVDAEWKLVGFRLYTSWPAADGRSSLLRLVHTYLRAFAARCGLELADVGLVPTLVAEEWYDDGTVAWEWERVSPGGHSPSAPST